MSDATTELKLKQFPAEDWNPVFRAYIAKELKFLPPDWLEKGLITVDAPKESDLRSQCDQVLQAKAQRPMRVHSILGQAEGFALGLKAVLGANRTVTLESPMTSRLMNAANDDLLPVLFYFKTGFNAARPDAYVEGINPMFAKPDPLFPGHPSYPSGHAAQSRLIARLLGAMFPHLEPELIAVADDIAFNRVVAGVHFPADSAAGQHLAEQIFELLMKDPKFACMVPLARAEWPEVKAPAQPEIKPKPATKKRHQTRGKARR